MVVQYKETGNVQEDIAQLAQAPGLEWMAEIADRDDVDWRAVQEVHDHWKITDSGIGGPGMQLASLAMADAFVSDYIRDTLAGKTYASIEEFEETKAQLKALGVDMSKLSAGIAAAALGKDIDTAASTGGNAAKNNAMEEMAIVPVAVTIPGLGEVVIAFVVIAGVCWALNKAYHAVKDGNSGFALVPEDAQSPTIHVTPEQAERLGINVHDGTQTDGVDTSLPGSPNGADVDTGPITTPENGDGSDSGTVTEDQSGQVDDSGGITGQVEITIEPKVKKQADKRGWTEEDIVQVIDKPEKKVKTKDTRWNNDSKTKRNDPATAYFDADGNYVVRNDVDGTIVQVSNKNDPDWKDPF